LSIADCGGTVRIAAGEKLGVVCPTYFGGLPTVVREFISAADFDVPQGAYVFFVATYGTCSGGAAHFAKKLLADKGVALSAAFDVRMPDTWTPLFDLSDAARLARIRAKEDGQIDAICKRIQNGEKGNFAAGRVPAFAARAFQLVYELARRTSHFWVESSCIGCGLCAKNCPVKAIALENGRPVWQRDKCAMCLGCLHRCPKFAIQYGRRTKRHGQYLHP